MPPKQRPTSSPVAKQKPAAAKTKAKGKDKDKDKDYSSFRSPSQPARKKQKKTADATALSENEKGIVPTQEGINLFFGIEKAGCKPKALQPAEEYKNTQTGVDAGATASNCSAMTSTSTLPAEECKDTKNTVTKVYGADECRNTKADAQPDPAETHSSDTQPPDGCEGMKSMASMPTSAHEEDMDIQTQTQAQSLPECSVPCMSQGGTATDAITGDMLTAAQEQPASAETASREKDQNTATALDRTRHSDMPTSDMPNDACLHE